ncbi:MAG: hypothetical protein J6Y20_04510 [Lachnospiraceae bacterium]|nr:hypothetical protein [Lachnospiraceae bacterium]
MSVIKEYFYNVKCDCCGVSLANEEFWRVDEDSAKLDAQEADFINLGGKDYCPNCYTIDENDNYVTKDGKVFDGDTQEEIITED